MSKSNKSGIRANLQSWTHTLFASSIDFYFATFCHNCHIQIHINPFGPQVQLILSFFFLFFSIQILDNKHQICYQTQKHNKPSLVEVFQILKSCTMLSSYMPSFFAFYHNLFSAFFRFKICHQLICQQWSDSPNLTFSFLFFQILCHKMQ